jgi:hypothetical protein
MATNKLTLVYHGLEDYIWSATSAQYDPAYESPRPDRDSDRTYWDPGSAGYTGGPWHSYTQVPALTMINYIEGKLAGVAVGHRDGDYAAAVMALRDLQQAYTDHLAGQLLSMIKAKGW